MYRRRLRLSLVIGGLFLLPPYLLRSTDAPAGPVDASQAKAREEVLKLEKEWVAAENTHDEATLRRILDENSSRLSARNHRATRKLSSRQSSRGMSMRPYLKP